MPPGRRLHALPPSYVLESIPIATLYEIVQDFTSAQRDRIAFIFIDVRAGQATARFLFATRLPDGQLRLPSRIATLLMQRRKRRDREPYYIEQDAPVTVALSRTPSVREQVAELNTSQLLGTLAGSRAPLNTWLTLESADSRWQLTTHAGSPAERKVWLSGQPTGQSLPATSHAQVTDTEA